MPNNAEPEETPYATGCTSASCKARTTPTIEARAPLPPVAITATRRPAHRSCRWRRSGGNGSTSGAGRSVGSGSRPRRTWPRNPTSSRVDSHIWRTRVAWAKYWPTRWMSTIPLSMGSAWRPMARRGRAQTATGSVNAA